MLKIMKNLKKVDYFRKYINDDKRQTYCGAILSLLTLALVALFAFFEFSSYLNPKVNREVVLMEFAGQDSDIGVLNTIPVYIDLVLYHTPCESNKFGECRYYYEGTTSVW